MEKSKSLEKSMPKSGVSSFLKNKYQIATSIVFILLSAFVFLIYKKTQRIQKSIKEHKKSQNEITNLKYGLQDTIKVVKDLRKQLTPEKTPTQSNQPSVVKVPKPVPETEKIEIESVLSEDIDGESESEIIELEEEDDSDEE